MFIALRPQLIKTSRSRVKLEILEPLYSIYRLRHLTQMKKLASILGHRF